MLFSYIPKKPIEFSSETLNKFPVSYGKSKVSGSLNKTYIMHSKSGCMPGQPSKFIYNSLTPPKFKNALKENRIIRAYINEKLINAKKTIGVKYSNGHRNDFTYDRFHPYDDESLQFCIEASYRQVYGNLNCFESERPVELERRLRNGDITIREFIRQLAKSNFYRTHYFEKVNQQRCIELNFKHILGRPPLNQAEVIKSIELINQEGFDHHIDYLIDSEEYFILFGDFTVPFMHCWNSQTGLRTSSFINSYRLIQSFATSDNAIHAKNLKNNSISGQSILLKLLI